MPWPHLRWHQDVSYSRREITVFVARTTFDWTTNVVGILICAQVCACVSEIVCACGCCSPRLYLTWPRWAPGPTTMTTRELYVKVWTSSHSQAIAGTLFQFYDGNWFSNIVTSSSLLTFTICYFTKPFLKFRVKDLFHYRTVPPTKSFRSFGADKIHGESSLLPRKSAESLSNRERNRSPRCLANIRSSIYRCIYFDDISREVHSNIRNRVCPVVRQRSREGLGVNTLE